MLAMLGNLALCALAGAMLAVAFLVPAGAVAGALNGLLVGLCVALADRRACANGDTIATGAPIRLSGRHWDSRA